METERLIIPLAAAEDGDAAAIGPKARGLARMIQLGLPVPEAFCVSSAAYREHLRENGLRGQIEEALAGLEDVHGGRENGALARVRKAIIEAPLAARLGQELKAFVPALGEGPVAVRSSATKEDLDDRSFAGQYDSIIGVTGDAECGEALKKCWASLWTDRAWAYRNRDGIDHLEVEMAVIMQMLIPAEVSGVLFTADPLTRAPDRITIECGYGLGEAVVSGRITPDRIVLERDGLKVCERQIAEQTFELIWEDTSGVGERSIDPPRSTEPCLDERRARSLARLGLKAEKAFGMPLDLEWVTYDGELYLVQARPITTAAPEKTWEDRQVWTNANAGEVMPDVMSPMTSSLLMPLVRRLFTVMGNWAGADLSEAPICGVIAGRVYFNLNVFAGLARRVPVLGKRSMAELLGGRQDAAAALGEIELADEDIPNLDFRWWKAAVRLPRLLLGFITSSPARGRRFLERAGEETEAQWRSEWRTLGDRELLDRARAITDSIIQIDGILFLAIGVVYTMSLYNLCRRWLGADGEATASRLLAGLGSLEHAEAGLDLWRLAVHARKHPDVERAVRDTEDFDSLRDLIAGMEGGDGFLQRWDALMWNHGHHTRGEAEFFNPRWAEQPDYVLEQLRSCLDALDRTDPLGRARALAAEREALAVECRRRFLNPFKRLSFRYVLRRAQEGAPLRENGKSIFVRRSFLVRLMLLELGARLAGRGVLEHRDDIFFLEIGEVDQAISGDGKAVRETIAARRAEYEANQTITPPSVVVGRFDPENFTPDPVDEDAEALSGIAVSPGRVTGTAKVILRSGEESVEPGEILVAPFTDPGWTPYFLNAAGIVMDLGGILSHGAIVAREYGLPCVVNVGPATKIIRTGDTITVDGDRGVVTIERSLES